MSEVVAQLNEVAEGEYESKYNEPNKTFQILEKTTENVIVMEASEHRVTMYKPLLQAKIDLQDKAKLFLKALGIPPTDGIERIEIRGGHRDLRQAIREQFQEHLQEHLANSKSSKQKRF